MSLPLIAEIDSLKLINNAKVVKSKIKNAKFCAVVKSNAYGHGLVEVSNFLYSYVDCFAVALTSEAYALRVAGIDKEILLLTPSFYQDIEKLIEYEITLSISTIKELIAVIEISNKMQKFAYVHISLNTGMNRLGFKNLNDINYIIKLVNESGKYIKITGAFSHFCKAENKKLTDKQFYTFLYLVQPLKEYNNDITLHISSSGGLLKDKKYHLDMVRVGILLYGYKPYEKCDISVERVMKIKAPVLQKHTNIKGENLLYGDDITLNSSAYIIRLGYADGFFRQGIKHSLTNLCMDLSAVKKITNKDYTVVLDDATFYAKKYDTCVYEILTSVSKRAKRIYLK